MTKNGWIKFYHRVASEPKWRGSTLAGRGLWVSLFAIAGATDRDGFIEGTDKEIAGLVGVGLKDFQRAWDGRPPGIVRAPGGQPEGITFPNWQQFQHSVSLDRQIERQKDRETLAMLPEDREWWQKLSVDFPGVNLALEHAKALDWHGASRVKSPKLFFRNWIARAAKDYVDDDGGPNLEFEEARIG